MRFLHSGLEKLEDGGVVGLRLDVITARGTADSSPSTDHHWHATRICWILVLISFRYSAGDRRDGRPPTAPCDYPFLGLQHPNRDTPARTLGLSFDPPLHVTRA